jgi:hypothetical protein
MISCITLKNTSFKLLKVKNVTEENIYKKCGYKTSMNFKKIHTWNLDDKCIELWCKEDTNIKKYNEHSILTKYSIKLNVNNKCIFFLKNNDHYINLETDVFNKFFDLKETIEISKDDINNENSNNIDTSNDINDSDTISDINDANLTSDINKTNELLNKLLHNSNSENDENFEFNSELSYEVYSYSEDEEYDTNCVISK